MLMNEKRQPGLKTLHCLFEFSLSFQRIEKGNPLFI